MIAPLRSLDEFSLVHGPPDYVSARRFRRAQMVAVG
jgi:hypothetical protein